VITAAAGLALLRAGGAARRLAASTARRSAAAAGPVPARIGAPPMTAEGKPPPVPRVRVTAPPGEHVLLEFCHPALALAGLACWFMFVLVHYRVLAWIALGILVVTIGAGLSWLASSTRQARARQAGAAGQAGPRWSFPRRLAGVHGLAAALAVTLTVLTALSASHG
jgi:hypothetical protein